MSQKLRKNNLQYIFEYVHRQQKIYLSCNFYGLSGIRLGVNMCYSRSEYVKYKRQLCGLLFFAPPNQLFIIFYLIGILLQ